MKKLSASLMVCFVFALILPPAFGDECVTCMGDANGDGMVNGADVPAFIRAFGTVFPDPWYHPCMDFNGDGAISGADIGGFIAVFNTVCP